jgi:hypothetical protein
VMISFADGDMRSGLMSDDSYVISFGWGDGSKSTQSLAAGNGQVAVGSHVYKNAGKYNVTILMTDDDGGSASGGLVVSVNASASPYDRLIRYLEGLGLPKNVLASLEAKLAGLQALLVKHDYWGLAGKIGAFMNEVRAQRGKKITGQFADEMLRLAILLLASFK